MKTVLGLISVTVTLLSMSIATANAQSDIDHISLSVTPIFLCNGQDTVSQGTGFYFLNKDFTYLITNIHVLTGHPPQDEKSPIGDNILFSIHRDEDDPEKIRTFRYPIFTADSKPIWLTSKTFPDADVAIIPLPMSGLSNGTKIVNKGIAISWSKTKLYLRPGISLSIIGYPYGFHDAKNSLPVWKTGNLASEPRIDFGGKPLLIADISAYAGMSGSPVFAIAQNLGEIEPNNFSPGRHIRFLGIFSALEMVNKKTPIQMLKTVKPIPGVIVTESLELGYVWKAKLIQDIIEQADLEAYDREIMARFPFGQVLLIDN